MTAIALERETNTYWNLLRNVSKEVKVALISKLSSSLIAESPSRKPTASQFCGIWDDAHYVDADVMVQQIRSSRRFRKREILSEK